MQNLKPVRRTSSAILIHDNATEAASRRSAQWLGLVVSALIGWVWLGQANTHSVFFVVMGLTSIGAANSVMAWYRMRRYAAARFAKYRANPSTHA
jgi:hypothetical protein